MVKADVYDAITIADEILRIAKKNGEALTPMKLLKLVYIAHGWSLAVLNRDLFKNRIEAWQYGPVIPDLYHATKQFGRAPIPLELVSEPEGTNVDPQVRSFLEDVYAKYGHLSAIGLSNLTHQAGSPWAQRYVEGMRNIEIPDDIIKHHYKGMLGE